MQTLKTQHSVVIQFVYAADEFTIDTEAMTVRHHPKIDADRSFANVIGAYAYAIGHDGVVSAMVYVSRDALDKAAQTTSQRTWAAYPEHCTRHYVLAKLEADLSARGKVA